MTSYTRATLLALPVRKVNEFNATTVGDYLTKLNHTVLHDVDQLVNYMFVNDSITWQDEIGYAFLDAGLVGIEDGTELELPDYEGTRALIAWLMEGGFGAPGLAERTGKTAPTSEEVLAVPMSQHNDAHVETIGDYLLALGAGVWTEQENFNGKRPFGNSNWGQDLELALAKAGLVEATIDEDGYLESSDGTYEDLIDKAVKDLPLILRRGLAAPKSE